MTLGSALTIASLIGTLIFSAPAFAQPVVPANEWTHGTTLDLFGGAATAPSVDTRGALGGGFGWELDHWVSLEGTGTWFATTQGDSAHAAELRAVLNLTRPNT